MGLLKQNRNAVVERHPNLAGERAKKKGFMGILERKKGNYYRLNYEGMWTGLIWIMAKKMEATL